ncbi:uncharacterized protein LOC123922638 [Trifolium pratense]|nr:uncharacterized protein LOC123922638 [Trifolium pratense]
MSVNEIAELHGATTDIHSLSWLHTSISWQQSRSLWLKEGDANSKYFHSVLEGRCRMNAISVIQVGGDTLEGVSPIRQAVFTHFTDHFRKYNVERLGVDNLLFKRLNHHEGSSLTKPFTELEVKSTVWDCDSYKSSCPDGINFGFIKDFWAELCGDVMRFISDFHRNGKLSKGINSTFIALIPKVDSPQRLNDFRPISLDRKILDGILIANEVVDDARKAKKELVLFKVDFEKANDSVDWGYLDKVMERIAFPTLWRKWFRECVGTATASILVNGNPTDEFPLERGLRQGDLLSPFLFLLAVEGLNVLMEAMVTHNFFTGYRIGESDPTLVSHLQFADDTLLLGEKSWANVRALRAALVLFKTMSGLKAKLPIVGDSRRLIFWEPVFARLKNRLSGWKGRFLSFGGCLVLLKFVLTSLHVYALSFFKAPSDSWLDETPLCERFGRLFALAETKSHTVAEMFSLGWGLDGAAWVWRRQLRAWEEELLGECQSLLSVISLQVQTSDRWQWQLDPDSGYTVRGAYQLLTTMDSIIVDDAEHLIWQPQVPLKVSIFAWRLLRDRLPTKSNLVTRGILSSAAHHCVSGCGVPESAHHLFIYCSTFGSIRDLVRSWIGISSTGFTSIRDHFVQFTLSAGGSRARRSFLQLIWLVSVWVVWTERNHRLFRVYLNTSCAEKAVFC